MADDIKGGASTGEQPLLCGEVVTHLIAGASWFTCALPKGHKEEGHRAAGNCVKHGPYLGDPSSVPQCPKWPDCIVAARPVSGTAPDSPKVEPEKTFWDGVRDAEQREATAIREGYKAEICGECDMVILAHKHFIRCQSTTCPMKDGKPSILEQLMAPAVSGTEESAGPRIKEIATALLNAPIPNNASDEVRLKAITNILSEYLTEQKLDVQDLLQQIRKITVLKERVHNSFVEIRNLIDSYTNNGGTNDRS